MAKDGGEVDTAVPDLILVQFFERLFHAVNDIEELSFGEIGVVVHFLSVSVFEGLGDELVVHLDLSGVLVGVDVVLLEFDWVIEKGPKWLDLSLRRV